jgi:hypothetical protein
MTIGALDVLWHNKYTKIRWGANTGSVLTSVDASSSEIIWPGGHDVSGLDNSTPIKSLDTLVL